MWLECGVVPSSRDSIERELRKPARHWIVENSPVGEAAVARLNWFLLPIRDGNLWGPIVERIGSKCVDVDVATSSDDDAGVLAKVLIDILNGRASDTAPSRFHPIESRQISFELIDIIGGDLPRGLE